MSVLSRLLVEAEKEISDPFLLCALVSLRTRQLIMTGKANTSTAQLVDSALNELIAGVQGWLGKEAVDIRPLLAHEVAERG